MFRYKKESTDLVSKDKYKLSFQTLQCGVCWRGRDRTRGCEWSVRESSHRHRRGYCEWEVVK